MHDDKVDENYDNTEFFTGMGGGMVGEQHKTGAGNGNGQAADHLKVDLAVNDDSEDETGGWR